MISSRRRKSQPRIETTKGRNGRIGGRKELDDPVTQVSALCGTEEHPAESAAPTHQKSQQYISQISHSPSPPLGKLKKSHPKASKQQAVRHEVQATEEIDTKVQELVDTDQQHDGETQEIITSVPGPVEDQTQDPAVPATAVPRAPPSDITMETITMFLQELDKQTQCTVPLPKFARFTSKRASRFEIPVNLQTLESFTPLSYLHQYCIVTPTKEQSYQRIFRKHCKLHIEDVLKAQYLELALSDSFGRTFVAEELQQLHHYVQWDAEGALEERDFIVIAAFLERMLCVSERESRSEQLKSLDQKDELEIADFTCIEDKLQGIQVPNDLLTLLLFIKHS